MTTQEIKDTKKRIEEINATGKVDMICIDFDFELFEEVLSLEKKLRDLEKIGNYKNL